MPSLAPIAAGRPKPIVPKPPERHPRARLGDVRVLARPHLVLADLGADDAFGSRGEPVDRLHRRLRQDDFFRCAVVQRELLAPVVDRVHPRLGLGLGAGLAQLGDERGQHWLGVADDGHVDRLVLADLGGIDVDVDDLGLAREGRELAGHAVVEAHAHRDEQVGLGDRVVGVLGAVHTGHPDEQVMVFGEAPLPIAS